MTSIEEELKTFAESNFLLLMQLDKADLIAMLISTKLELELYKSYLNQTKTTESK